MARIPIYQERQQASQAFAAPDLRAPDVGAGAIGRGLQQVGQGLQNLAVGQLRLDTENGKAWAAQAGGEADLTWAQRYKQFQETAKPGAANFTRDVLKDFDPYADELLKSAPDEYSKKFIAQKLSSLRLNLARESLTFESNEGRNYRILSTEDGINKSAQAVALNPNPAFAETTIGQNDAMIDSMWLTPTKKEELKRKNRETIAGAYFTTLAQTNPNAIVGAFKSSGASDKLDSANVRESTISFIMNKLEGSAYVANDAGAGPARHGIVEKYNPGFNAKTGTKEQAAQVYRNIWNEIKGDTFPPDLAVVLMDTAVNMGAGKARALLAESGGNIDSFMTLRQQHYDKLVRDNPEQYAQYEKGWQNRQIELRKFVDSGQYAGVEKTGNPLIDSLPISKQLTILKMANDNATAANIENTANGVWSKFGPQTDIAAASEDVMRAQIDIQMRDKTPAERKAAYDIITNKTAVHNRSANERKAESVSGIWEMALASKPLDEITRSPEFQALPGDQKVTLIGQIQTFQTKGESLEQQARYLDLTNEPAKLAAMSNSQIIALAPQLGQKLTADLMRKRADLNNPEKISAATIDNEDFNMLANQAGLKPFDAKKTDKEKASLGQLRYAVEQRIYTEQVARKRQLTREERLQVMQQELDNKVMVDVTMWKDKQMPISLVQKDDLGKTYVVVEGKEVPLTSIPATSRTMIIRQLRAVGRPVTEQAIAEVFVQSRNVKVYGSPVPAAPTTGAK
jgi:hypothetical protein